jgi:hypothetical protein
VLAAIFIAVYPIGVPIFFFLSIWRYRKRLDEVSRRAGCVLCCVLHRDVSITSCCHQRGATRDLGAS